MNQSVNISLHSDSHPRHTGCFQNKHGKSERMWTRFQTLFVLGKRYKAANSCFYVCWNRNEWLFTHRHFRMTRSKINEMSDFFSDHWVRFESYHLKVVKYLLSSWNAPYQFPSREKVNQSLQIRDLTRDRKWLERCSENWKLAVWTREFPVDSLTFRVFISHLTLQAFNSLMLYAMFLKVNVKLRILLL